MSTDEQHNTENQQQASSSQEQGKVALTERQTALYLARLAEQTERFPEMVEQMKKVASYPDEMSTEERNLLSVAYKNVIGTLRSSWRLVLSVKQKEESRGHDDRIKQVTDYKEKIEAELEDVCKDVLKLLENTLIPAAQNAEAKVFYYKMQGDYNRYLAEFQESDGNSEAAVQANKAYKKATEIAQESLSPTHPIRLGLALNYSVYFYEIANLANEACQLAKEAFEEAISELDNLPEHLYRDSTLIMQLLRDNLRFWQADAENQEEPQEAKEKEETKETKETKEGDN